jgi:hypothetical protein
MRDNQNFVCLHCGQPHRLETLLEYPLPEDISEITSGKSAQSMKVIGKDAFLINEEYLLLKCVLRININDLPDELDIQTWLRVDRNEFLQKYEDRLEKEAIVCTGKLVYPIPFYGMSDYPVVKVDLNAEEPLPIGMVVVSGPEFYRDWQEGISSGKLIELLSYLNHL